MFKGTNVFEDLVDITNQHLDQDNKINIDEIMKNEVNGLIDFGVWRETVALQKTFNDSVAPGWMQDTKQEKYDYWMAILDETIEVLNSRHWKWWKNSSQMNTVDWNNVKVEMLDIFFFLLSIAIQQNAEEIIFATLLSSETSKQHDITKKSPAEQLKFFDEFWTKILLSVQMKALPMVVSQWVYFWNRMGLNVTDLFKEYRIKAALNNIRQEFGYGVKNSYKKMWPDPDNTATKIEDNAVAWKLTKEIDNIDTNSLEEFTDLLRNYYLEHLTL